MFIFLKILQIILGRFNETNCQRLSNKASSSLTCFIYNKLLTSSIFIRSNLNKGKLNTFIQNDVETIHFIFNYAPNSLVVPFQILISMYMLFSLFGYTFIYSFILFIFLAAISWIVEDLYYQNQKKLLFYKDSRVKLTNSILHMLKMIKMFTYENLTFNQINEKRESELNFFKKIQNVMVLSSLIHWMIPFALSVVSIGVYTYIYGNMKIENILVAIEIYDSLAYPLYRLPIFTTSLLGVFISMKRIERFLNEKDIEPNENINHKEENNKNSPNKKEKEIKLQYQICDRIKIELINNYGHSKYIGLSGIEFFDDIDSLIDINSNLKEIKMNQIKNNRQKKMIYNLFNGKNNTKDINYMFYTRNNQASFEIEFKQQLKIKKIIIYNYNDDKYRNIGTKKISFIFYKSGKAEKTIKSIYLNKNIGEEGIEYGQILKYPFNNLFNIKKYKNLNEHIKCELSNLVYNKEHDYYCPSFPSGFIIKLLLVNNWGNNEYIGFEQIKLFNENNEEIIMSENDEKLDFKEHNNIPNIYLFPDKLTINPKINPIILTKYKNINCSKNEDYVNRIYIIFNNFVMISKIYIKNYCKYDEISVKCIKIFIDDNLIFEGQLNKNDNEIFFSNKEMEDFYSKKDKIESNNIIADRYLEKEFENGTKILSII
jgi:hypothetical protein